jgi:hypothetical protein
MFAKKTRTDAAPTREYRKELQYLYARRNTVDTLIQSLEHYDRFRARTAVQPFKRKTA